MQDTESAIMVTDGNFIYSNSIGSDCSIQNQNEMVCLFNEHYGVWNSYVQESKVGKRVLFSRERLEGLLKVQGSFVLSARKGSCLIGYAIGTRIHSEFGSMSWITQLVVHSSFQNKGIARKLLGSAWCFSNDFAWGLATANPYAVRALETATLRRCEPKKLMCNLNKIEPLLPLFAAYLNKKVTVSASNARISTNFPVDHGDINQRIASVSPAERPWLLGKLPDGDEWLAVTFQEQEPRRFTLDDLERMLETGESLVAEAYDRMAAGAASRPHPWMRHTHHEVKAIQQHLKLPVGAKILDLGCGNGRHAVRLAELGYNVTAIERSEVWLNQAKENAKSTKGQITFRRADARDLDLRETYDAVICLYDVVGSFTDDRDNKSILDTIRRHLSCTGKFALSVMNRHLAEIIAEYSGDIRDNPNLLHDIEPSKIMQNTGGIWDPSHLMADTRSGVVYRREQFNADNSIPIEMIVCDRRFFIQEIMSMCSEAGLEAEKVLPVGLGNWITPLVETDGGAKELLCFGQAV